MSHDGKPLLRGCHSGPGPVRSSGPVPVGPAIFLIDIVRCTLDAIPAMDETSHILNLLAQGLRLDSRTMKRAMLVTVLVGRP